MGCVKCVLGSREGRKTWSKFWKVLFIDYHHHTMIREAGIHPCDLSQFLLALGSAT